MDGWMDAKPNPFRVSRQKYKKSGHIRTSLQYLWPFFLLQQPPPPQASYANADIILMVTLQ